MPKPNVYDGTDLECKELFRSCAAVKLVAVVIGLIEQLLCSLVWLFGEGAHARSDVAKPVEWHKKKLRERLLRDLPRSDNAALLGAAPLS